MPKPYYEDEWATIYHGDCNEILPSLDARAIVTDPPYGVDFKGADWDKEIPQIATKLPELCEAVAIIMGITAIWDFPRPKWVACWARPASSSRSKVGGFSHWSPVLLYGKCKLPVDFKSWHAIAHAYPKGFGHPSPKPLALMEWLVQYVGDVAQPVVDPFMGSGTTLLAAKNRGRKSIGIELEEKYCELAAKRLGQGVLWPA